MPKKYDNEIKEKIVRAYVDEKRSRRSLANEYGISYSTVTAWTRTKESGTTADNKVLYLINKINDYQKVNSSINATAIFVFFTIFFVFVLLFYKSTTDILSRRFIVFFSLFEMVFVIIFCFFTIELQKALLRLLIKMIKE